MNNKEISQLYYDIQKSVSTCFDIEPIDKENSKVNNTCKVDYLQLEEQLKRAIFLTKHEMFVDNTFHSIFIWGPTGSGKSEIVKQIAESEGCIYHKLEIQKVPIEELAGFPYLHKNDKDQTVVRLAHPTILPPSDSLDVWILHLDEFNKAETDQMAATMNLVLTGEIGGSADYNEKTGESIKYKLPKKTIIIGSGNPKNQKNVTGFNAVNSFDTATAERWHRNLYLDYNAISWLQHFGFKDYKFINGSIIKRIPEIISYFIFDKYIENGDVASPFLIPKVLSTDEAEGDSTMSPRAWTLAANNMILDMYMEWTKEKTGIDFETYVKNPNSQIKSLINNIYEFGANGDNLVREIIARYVYFYENRILPKDVLENYSSIREKVKSLKDKKGALLYLLLGIAFELKNNINFNNIKIPAINLSTFIIDTDIPVEDLTLFIYEINQNKNEQSKQINDLLYSINERYKNAHQGYYFTSKDFLTENKNKDII